MTEFNAPKITAEPIAAGAPAELPDTAASASPWISQLLRGKAAMSERVAQGGVLPFRVAEFWAEGSWPLHTIEADESLAPLSGDFLVRLAKQGLAPAMNVIVQRKSAQHVGAVFGPHAYQMANDYDHVAALVETRKKAIDEGKAPAPAHDDDFKNLSKAQKELKSSFYGAGVDSEDKKPEGPRDARQFAYLNQLERRSYPCPSASVEPEAWEHAGSDAKELCSKFGLRAVNVPVSFDANQARDFVARLDSALTELAGFLGTEPSLIGLGQWLGLRARAPGERTEKDAAATEDAGALAEREKEAAKTKKSDSEHGMFMGGFIQIEVSHNFEPVVLAHEWFHSLDLWSGSREIVAKKPWMGWQFFASNIAFTDYEQSPALKKWHDELVTGGVSGFEKKPDYLDSIPEHAFLSQMRFDKERDPEGDFHLSMGKLLAARFMRCFGSIPIDTDRRASTAEQAEKLGEMIADAARVHALDHRNSAQTEESLARRRKEFYVEWGDLTSMWSRRQAGVQDETALGEMESLMRSKVLGCLAGAWNWAHLERQFPNPDVHLLQAIRMDTLSGGMVPYFSTPHELLAYKMEMLFLARGQKPSADDKVGQILMGWLSDEIVPALREARDVSFSSLMGVKSKAPTP